MIVAGLTLVGLAVIVDIYDVSQVFTRVDDIFIHHVVFNKEVGLAIDGAFAQVGDPLPDADPLGDDGTFCREPGIGPAYHQRVGLGHEGVIKADYRSLSHRRRGPLLPASALR